MDEKNFIKEKIVGQKISWKKKVVKALSFLFSGGVFGLGIFLVLFFLLPILPEKKEGKEKETVAFTEEASTETESGTEKNGSNRGCGTVRDSETGFPDFRL